MNYIKAHRCTWDTANQPQTFDCSYNVEIIARALTSQVASLKTYNIVAESPRLGIYKIIKKL